MKKLMALVLTIGLSGCGDFVDEDGNTSIRQFAQGVRSLGDKVTEMGEAIARDADVEAVPWERLVETIPEEIGGARRLDSEGDEATDRNGAGMSMAHGRYVLQGDTMFVGVADLGALRSGVGLALRWVAPLFGHEDVDGKHHAEQFVAGIENLFHGDLIRATTDPASRDSRQTSPNRLGIAATDQLRIERPDNQDCDRPTQKDPDGSGEKHHQRFGSEL